MDSLPQADRPETFQGVIRLDEGQVRSHVDQVVRESVEQTLNGLLQAEADRLCGADRYERSPDRIDSRAGHPSKRRRGGQAGHTRYLRQLVPPEQLAAAIDRKPVVCSGCGAASRGDDPEPIRHQIAELPPIRPEVIEYRLHRLACRRCGHATRGPLPAGVPCGAFGPRWQAWAGLLSGAYRLSKRQVQRLLGGLLGLSISLGMVAKLQRQAAAALAGPAAEIRRAVRQADALHVDETGWRQEANKAWLWVGVTAEVTTFSIHRSRGAEALESLLGERPGRPGGHLGPLPDLREPPETPGELVAHHPNAIDNSVDHPMSPRVRVPLRRPAPKDPPGRGMTAPRPPGPAG